MVSKYGSVSDLESVVPHSIAGVVRKARIQKRTGEYCLRLAKWINGFAEETTPYQTPYQTITVNQKK